MFVLFIIAICFQLVFGQNYYITNPIQGTIFTADKVESILWNKLNEPQLLDVKVIRIELVDADSNNARFVKLIAELPSNATSFDWKVSNDLVPKSDYFLRMSARSKNGRVVYNYSSRFAIVGGSGTYQVPPKGNDVSNDADTESLDVMIVVGMMFMWMN